MKKCHAWSVYIAFAVSGLIAAEPESTVTERGPHHRVIEKVLRAEQPDGSVLEQKSRQIDLATGLHYREGDAWLAAQLEYLRANRDATQRAIAAMPGLSMAHVEATYLAWIDARGLGVADAHALFLEHGVALSPGAQFGEPRFVRLNFGTQRARLAQALERMRSALGGLA